MHLASRSGGRRKEHSNESEFVSEAETDFEDATFSNEEIIFPTQKKYTDGTSIPNRNHLFFFISPILIIMWDAFDVNMMGIQ